MKNKIIKSFTVLLAALMITGGFSMTAYAQTPEETPPPEVTEPEPTPAQPLTPDGNATLVDDFGGNKQLITVTTKSGDYFYILIDHDDEGENTVHFLNQVDEANLMALMEDENGKTETPPAVCICRDKCVTGTVNLSCPVCKIDTSGCVGKAAATEPEPEEQPQKEQKSNPAGLLLIVLVLAGLGGGAFYFFKVLKPKQAVKGSTDLDDLEFDEYDEEPEADTPALEETVQDEEEQEDEE